MSALLRVELLALSIFRIKYSNQAISDSVADMSQFELASYCQMYYSSAGLRYVNSGPCQTREIDLISVSIADMWKIRCALYSVVATKYSSHHLLCAMSNPDPVKSSVNAVMHDQGSILRST